MARFRKPRSSDATGRRSKSVAATESDRRPLPHFKDRILTGDGLSVSPFCLGMVDNWRLIPAAFDMGINFFFITTDMHWSAYEASRRGMKSLLARRNGVRDEIAIAGACYPTQPEFMLTPFDELVTAVPGMKRVDLLVAGGVYGADLLARAGVLRRVADRMKSRAIGASFHDRQAAVAAANHNIVDLCYVRYNPEHPAARHDLFPRLAARHPPLFNFKSTRGFVPHDQLRRLKLDASLWYPDVPDYYRYALTQPRLAGLLFSVAHLAELLELASALHKGGLTTQEEDHLEELAVLTRQAPLAGNNE